VPEIKSERGHLRPAKAFERSVERTGRAQLKFNFFSEARHLPVAERQTLGKFGRRRIEPNQQIGRNLSRKYF
jgi:hypothetical protein